MTLLSLRLRAIALALASLLPHAAQAQTDSGSMAYTMGRLIGYVVMALLVILIVRKFMKK